jgi:hypothetical protein
MLNQQFGSFSELSAFLNDRTGLLRHAFVLEALLLHRVACKLRQSLIPHVRSVTASGDDHKQRQEQGSV